MSKQTQLSPRRAEILSLLAFFLHLLFFLLVLFLSSRVNTLGGKIASWHFLGGTIIWLMLLLQFRQRRLAEEERLDAEQYQRLRREGKDKSVFEGTVSEDTLHIAQRRLQWMEKYLLTVFSVAIVLYLLGIGYWLLMQVRSAGEIVLASQEVIYETSAVLAGIALVSFLFSRYAVGMSQESVWRPLRAGGSYLFSNALASFFLAIVLMVSNYGYLLAEKVFSYVLVVLLLALGVEIILNLLLDAFRPRVKGQYRRSAYESRILGLFCEPGGILKTFAHAIDYQFGFKVSETWFYRLLEKAIVPLLIVAGMALYFLSCVSVVPSGHVGVLERWGRPLNVEAPYSSGLHVKLPWPIDTMQLFPKEQVQIMEIGFERGAEQERIDDEDPNPILWTVKHWESEPPFLVAVQDPNRFVESSKRSKEEGKPGASGSLNFDLLVVPLVIHYCIKDVGQYGYGRERCYLHPKQLLESIAYRETVHYCARSHLDKLMGPGRDQTARYLKQAIQDQADAYEMGIEILFVGLGSIHPPVAVAEDFEKVVSALQDKQAEILKSQGKASEILAEAKGKSFVLESEARAYQYERGKVAEAEANRFAQQLTAYEEGGSIYLEREYLSVLDDLLPGRRKYVIDSENIESWVYEFDLKEKLEPDLFRDIKIPSSEQEKPK
jgi:membrane protease subunit HflK